METLFGILSLLLIIMFIVGMIVPKKFAPFLGEKKIRLKIFGIFLVLASILGGISPDKNGGTNKIVISETKEEKAKKAEAASKEIQAILNTMPSKQYDKIEDNTWYQPFEGNIPPVSQVYWYMGVKNNDANERLKIVDFSDGMEWIFFDEVTFFSSEGKWKYNVDSFAGQTGGGKQTQIVWGGKYEILDVPFKNVEEGIKILISGNDPTIRLSGSERSRDYSVTEEEIAKLKNAYKVYELLKITDGKVVLPKTEDKTA